MKISGYASRFDERDAGGDTVHRGAFAASLLSQGRALPMLSDHQRRVGSWHRATEDDHGLFVEGEVSDPALRRLIRAGRVRGLSIGYRTRRSRDGPGRRDLLELDLKEISVVAFPMLGSARIEAIDDTLPETTTEDPTEHANHRRIA